MNKKDLRAIADEYKRLYRESQGDVAKLQAEIEQLQAEADSACDTMEDAVKLAQQRGKEIAQLQAIVDSIREHESDLVRWTAATNGRAAWYECVLCGARSSDDSAEELMLFRHKPDCALAPEEVKEAGDD